MVLGASITALRQSSAIPGYRVLGLLYTSSSSSPFSMPSRNCVGRSTLFCFSIALTLWAGVAFMLRRAARKDSFPGLHDNNPAQTRAAFRDGLYLGRLAAQSGEEPHISEARGSNQADRILFTAGYAQGYDGTW